MNCIGFSPEVTFLASLTSFPLMQFSSREAWQVLKKSALTLAPEIPLRDDTQRE